MPDELNVIQSRAFEHLTSHQGDTGQRTRALSDLIAKGAFDAGITAGTSERFIKEYLDDNPRGLCDAGIGRFRQAVFPHDFPAELLVTLHVTVEGTNGVFGRSSHDDNGLVLDICRQVNGLESRGMRVTGVDWRSYIAGRDNITGEENR